ncbi:hypothetical protein EYC80_007025 [Monilinia laxa]|uniref:Uncharacterized protein n=1 Tax=Monilinia laxa TaxID=61186 RepID=A0A5N6K0A8_MONLA|nr:hypothetical protein EYC80_007025 [Monilinia laxa]
MSTLGARSYIKPQSNDLWNEALKNVHFTDTSAFITTGLEKRQILEEILDLVQKQELKAQERKWKLRKKNGQVIILRDVFAKLVIWIDKFKAVGDILIQYDPVHASLPWAFVRFLLQAAVSDIHTNGAVLEAMEILVNLLARYEIVEYLYLRVASHTTALLKEAVVKLYTVILDYLLQAHAYFEPHLLKKITKSIFQSEESTNTFVLSINQRELEVEKYMCLVSDETLGNIDRNMGGLTNSMHTFQASMQTLEREISEVKLTGNNIEYHLVRALKDLEAPIQRITSQISDIQDHLKEKERWLLKKKEFEEWMNTSTSSILWLHGIPGSGKSMLVCHVIEYLKNRAQQRCDSAPIAYFYCARNVNEPERADPTELLRNILEQLCSLDAETPIRKPLSNAYLSRKKEARGRKPEKLNLEETVDIILELLETNPATIVIDGLDECDPIKRNDLLLALQKIITKSNSIVKVFVSSRDDHDLVCHLVNSPNLYIHAADNTEDIVIFIRSRVQEAIRDGKLLCGRVSDRLKNIIIGRLIKEANGMFRLYENSLCPLWTKEITTQVLLWTIFLACKYDLSEIVAQLLPRANAEQAFTEKTREGLNCAQASGYFDSPLTIDLLHDITRTLLPKELDFALYWTSAGNVAFHHGNLQAANRIWHKRYKANRRNTQPKKYCIRPFTVPEPKFSASYWLVNSLSPGLLQHTLLETSEQSEKSFITGASILFESSHEYVGVCDKCACSIWRPLDMVILNIVNAFLYLHAVQPVAPIEKELKVEFLAKIVQDLLLNHDGLRLAPNNYSWIVSMLEFIILLGHNVYDLLIFMHYIMEAFLFMLIHDHGYKTEASKYSTWFLGYRTFFDGMNRIRRILNEQKVIDWKVLFLARDIDEGKYFLLELLKLRMKIAPEAINVALSNWDKKMVKKLLEYNSVEINDEVIRFVAGNIKHGEGIMELLLLAQEEREASESAHTTQRSITND